MGFMDDLNDMFNKSAAAAGDMLNKGASAAGRMADSANLRFKQGEIDRRWKDACAALGESVIEAVKADPALLSGREQMMADLDAIAKERADVADELQRIAAEAEAARRRTRKNMSRMRRRSRHRCEVLHALRLSDAYRRPARAYCGRID